MPQIRCPNCGLTISMKNRKEIDLDLITHAVHSGPRTFTYLLHATKLPRKTLSLRLKELCEGGMILKREGVYTLNGMNIKENRSTAYFKRFSAMPYDKRIRAGVLLALLIVSTPIAVQVLASLFMASLPVATEPVIIGRFNMVLEVHGVSNLYAWQVYIDYNKDQIKALAVEAGDFPGQLPMKLNYINPKGYVLIGDSLSGNASGWTGSCKLTTITFGYYVESPTLPKIVPKIDDGGEGTVLLNPKCWVNPEAEEARIPIDWETTLTLTVENP